MLRDHFKKASAGLGYSRARILGNILKERPDLARQDPGIAESGSSYTFIFENEILKHPYVHGPELGLLQSLPELTFNAPKITYASPTGDFYGMTRLEGVTLYTALHSMTKTQVEEAGRDVAKFKIDLEQKLPQAALGKLTDFSFNTPFELEGDILRFKSFMDAPDIQPILQDTCDAYDRLTSYFSKVVARKPVVIHGDLHDENILVHAKTFKVTGVIDFGNACKSATPEAEVNSVFARHKTDFYNAFKTAYFEMHPSSTLEDYNCNRFIHFLDNDLSYMKLHSPIEALAKLKAEIPLRLPRC